MTEPNPGAVKNKQSWISLSGGLGSTRMDKTENVQHYHTTW